MLYINTMVTVQLQLQSVQLKTNNLNWYGQIMLTSKLISVRIRGLQFRVICHFIYSGSLFRADQLAGSLVPLILTLVDEITLQSCSCWLVSLTTIFQQKQIPSKTHDNFVILIVSLCLLGSKKLLSKIVGSNIPISVASTTA